LAFAAATPVAESAKRACLGGARPRGKQPARKAKSRSAKPISSVCFARAVADAAALVQR
jgi:hypothetical protein